ncbi:CPCC family cysteine-rich protein [Sinorhizobium meliloti]|uniref:CPCC family cysteine-rich protein n=1 Tax=Rhizobium meliloti TaxID=382 RepID=UPI00338F3130
MSFHHCPCCKHRTLSARAEHEICPICFWQDDGQDDADANDVRGGPNGCLSLTTARANYAAFGASDERLITKVRLRRSTEKWTVVK